MNGPGRVLARCWLAAVALALIGGAGCRDDEVRRRKEGPAVVTVDPADEASRSVDEREPNDERSKAQPLTAERPVSAKLVARNGKAERDWYRVDSDREQILSATASGIPGVDLRLEAFDAEGHRLVKVDNSGPGGGETLVNLAVSAGRYLLRVTASELEGDGGAYRMSYAVRPVEPGEELEPNWKRQWASKLVLGEDAVGYCGWRTDVDWYRVELAELESGSLLRAELENVDTIWGHLALRDDRGHLVQRRIAAPGRLSVLANLAVPEATPEIYLVVRCGRSSNVESRYALRLVASPAGDREREPNDTVSSATELTPGKSRRGIIADRYDKDVFSVAVAQPSRLSVTVRPPYGLDAQLELLDGAGKPTRVINGGPAGKREMLLAAFVRPPRALVRVRAVPRKAGDPTSSYRIMAALHAPTSWEREPNDVSSQATPWPADSQRIAGFLHPAKDVDHFSMAGTGSSVQLELTSPSGGAIKLQVLAPRTQAVLAEASRSSATKPLRVIVSTAANESYLVRVSEMGGASSENAYTLQRTAGISALRR